MWEYPLFHDSFFPTSLTDTQVIRDARQVVGDPEYEPVDPTEFCNRIFTTCYMGTENSSAETRACAKDLAEEIGR